jgi:hypothetical protein
VSANAVVVDGGEKVALRRIMQRIVQAHDGAGSVTEGGVRRHILHAFAIDVDLACVAQAFEILRSRH